jgi:hypothetical protein
MADKKMIILGYDYATGNNFISITYSPDGSTEAALYFKFPLSSLLYSNLTITSDSHAYVVVRGNYIVSLLITQEYFDEFAMIIRGGQPLLI